MWDAEPNPVDWKRFHDWTAKMDTIRFETFATTMPELQRVFHEARAKETRTRSAQLKSAGKKG